jgi:predicted permease
VIGRSVRLDGHPHTIVGVLPAGFDAPLPRRAGGGTDIEVWKNPDTFWQNGDVWGARGAEFGILRLVGRLSGGASLADAQGQADAVMRAAREVEPEYARAGFAVALTGLQDRMVASVRPTLLLLTGAVVFVLLIACANVANLLIVRARARRRELAVRIALGSPRGRIGALLLLESVVLATLGAVAGLAFTYGFLRLVPVLAPPELPRFGLGAVDGSALLYATAAAVATTLLVGVAPALAAVRTDPAVGLGNGRTDAGRTGRLRDALVVIQVGLSLVLLVGTGLLTTSIVKLQQVDPGFDPEGLYTFGVSIPGAQYGWPEEAGRFYREVEERVAAVPGVRAAGVVWPMPFAGSWSGDHEVVEGEPRALGLVPYYLATEAYFPTAGIPLLEGRLFREGDARNVTVVARSVAERAFGDRPAVGGQVRADPWGGGMQAFEVIGVVGDIRDKDLREPGDGGMYFDARSWSWVDWEVHVVARTDVAGAGLLPAFREAVAELDADLPLAHPEPMAARVASQTASIRFVLTLLTLFALSAGTLAFVGLYGVVSYGVGLRRREIGVRMALGSARSGIARMVVGRGVALAGAGVVVGGAVALLLGGLLEGMLFGVRPRDPATLLVAAAVMVAAAVLASWLPARRAARTPPAEVLRGE